MTRDIRYVSVAGDIAARFDRGEFAAGELLPSETDLAGQYRVSRVTVRRALAQVKLRGLVDSRQGFGWYAVGAPLRQSLDSLQTIEAQIEMAGRRSARRVLEFAFKEAAPRVAAVLGTGHVLEVSRVNFIDGRPFACVTVWVPERLASDLSRRAVEERPLYELIGIALGRAVQVISAAAASSSDAKLLRVPEGSPLLQCERTTTDPNGKPVLFSVSLFNPLVTEFVAELPSAADGETAGLRLVR